MKQTAVFMSLILIFNLLLFVPVFAEQEIIAEPSVAAGYNHVLGLNQYGRVFSAGDNTYGQCLTYNWIDITQIAAGKYFSAGLCKDGSVVVAGKQEVGSEFLDIDISRFVDIVEIAAGDNFLAALDKDGYVHIVGNTQLNTSSWEGIRKIACGANHVVGIREDGTCVGAGKSVEDSLGRFSNITDIYAGADLTVLKDENGAYYHVGTTVDMPGYEEFDEYWQSRNWENVIKIVISLNPGTSGNGIVTAIKNDGSIVTDEIGEYIFNNTLTGVKDLAVGNGYAICLEKDNNVRIIGSMSTDETLKNEYLNQVSEFDLEMEPLREVYIKKPQVVVANSTVAFVLQNGQVKGIGAKDLSVFERINQLSADMGFDSYDIFIGVNKDGRVVSNLDDDTWLDEWMYAIKVAPTVCTIRQEIAVALRWDKKMLCYGTQPIEVGDVVDVACGNGFVSYVKENGKVGIYEKKAQSSAYPFDATDWSDIKSISNGIYHIAALKNDGTCVATGGFKSTNANKTGECNVLEWEDIKDVLCGEKFTIALRKDGMCEFTGWNVPEINKLKDAILKTDETDNEYWENISQIYSSRNTVVAYKEDGSFDYVTTSTSADFTQLKNTYYKDNTFYTFKVEENVATVEYYSDEDIEVYFSYFDEEGRPIGFEKKNLPSVDSLTKAEFVNNKSHSFTISVGEPTADKMKFYMEQEADGDTVKIRHCSLEGQRIMLAFYDDEGNMIDIKVKTLGEINSMTETSFSCATATKYKLFIRDGALPLYKAEGTLN